jgi:ABC-type lipoprotein release transport system permease subunit
MILKIAWRNVWRNKRRTLITAAAIFFAVLFSVVAESFNRGIFDGMIDNTVRFYSGYGQVLKKGYWEERTLDKSFELSDSLSQQLLSIDGVDQLVPRLESFALASYGKITKSSMLVGIDPSKENQLTGLSKRVVKGAYLKADDQAILISEGLANKFKLDIQDTLVLISQGYHGVNAAGKYPVKGIVSFGSPELNATMVFLPLATAQWFYGAEGLLSTLVLDIENKSTAERAVAELKKTLNADDYELKDWKQMMPEIIEMKALKESSNKIMLLVLYLIVSFGIFGVIVMMTKERQYEFAVLLSIGMQRRTLSMITWLETVLLGVFGALIGIVASYAMMYYILLNPIKVTGDMAVAYEKFGIEPILLTSVDLDIFANQAITVFVITSLIALYPLNKIWKMKPVDAMRS